MWNLNSLPNRDFPSGFAMWHLPTLSVSPHHPCNFHCNSYAISLIYESLLGCCCTTPLNMIWQILSVLQYDSSGISSQKPFFIFHNILNVIILYYFMVAEATRMNIYLIYLDFFVECKWFELCVQRVFVAVDTLSIILKAVVILLCGQGSVKEDNYCVTQSSIQFSFHPSAKYQFGLTFSKLSKKILARYHSEWTHSHLTTITCSKTNLVSTAGADSGYC